MLAGAELYPQLLDQTLALTNAAMGSIFTGVAQAAFEAALAHTQTRMQGGKRLCEHQLVQKRLFDMYCRVESSRALSRNAFIWNAAVPPSNQFCVTVTPVIGPRSGDAVIPLPHSSRPVRAERIPLE